MIRRLLTLALVENLQRNDLTAIDEAAGYQRLGEEFKLPQSEIARLVGRNRSTVANLLRLLKLPDEVKALVQQGKLSEGHARALLAVESESEVVRLAREAVSAGWSVRDTEARARGETPASPVLTPSNGTRTRAPQKMADGRRPARRGCTAKAARHRCPGNRPPQGPRLPQHQLLLQRRSRSCARDDPG